MTLLATDFIEIDGKKLRIARSGPRNAETVVLLHGYPEDLHVWSEVLLRLSDHYDVIAFDWPGMGESETWRGGAAPQQQAERLLRILDALDVERCHVVGADMGGQPALVFGAKYAERTRSVTVMNSLLFGDQETSWEIRLLREHGFNVRALEWLPRAVFLRARYTFLEHPRALEPELAREFWRNFRRPEVRHFISRMCAGYQGSLPRLPSIYARVRAPVHALWGERDKHFPPSHAQALARTLPGSRLTIVARGQHWMMLERADELASAMKSFYGESRTNH